jgi:Bacterial conjugation TrbI-like protein
MAGLAAAILARNGFAGAGAAVEGRHGFLQGYAPNPDASRLTAGLGEGEWELLRTGVKPYPSCRYGHAGIVLMEKGTKIVGEYQGGLNRGQYRLFVLWTRAVTPRGIAIDVASSATDALGRGGVDGRVNNFFWQRFGTALLFSLVEDAATVGSEAVGNSASNILTMAVSMPRSGFARHMRWCQARLTA